MPLSPPLASTVLRNWDISYISKHGIEVDSDNVQAVRDFPVTRNSTDVRAFHGLCNYFR
jgi:hypothetical protein